MSAATRPTKAQMEKAVSEWNVKHQIGARVRCWPGARDGDSFVSETVTDARILGGHTAGVYVKVRGFMALSHVEAVAPMSADPRPDHASFSAQLRQLVHEAEARIAAAPLGIREDVAVEELDGLADAAFALGRESTRTIPVVPSDGSPDKYESRRGPRGPRPQGEGAF